MGKGMKAKKPKSAYEPMSRAEAKKLIRRESLNATILVQALVFYALRSLYGFSTKRIGDVIAEMDRITELLKTPDANFSLDDIYAEMESIDVHLDKPER